MAIEGLDVSLLIENGGFVPQADVTVRPVPDEPTLDAALAQAARTARADRDAALEAPDLWLNEGTRGPGRIAHAPMAPIDADAPQDHPLAKERLTLAELGHVLANRQFDSTDYWWDETSTGDYEWAQRNFQDDVYAGVQEATQGATSPEEAAAMAQAYLNSIGLSGLVHIDGSAGGSNDEIVITAPTNTYHPTTFMPDLSLDRNVFDGFDPRPVYDTLDASAHTITVEIAAPLTEQQLLGLERLRQQIERTTAMLHLLPITGVFTFPDGKTISVAELKALWARTDFVITTHNYSENGIPSIPGGGAAIRNDGDPVFEVNIDFLTNSAMSMEWNRTFFPLHELAHVTAAGYAIFMAMDDDGVKTDYEHLMNEAFATSLAIAIGEAAGYQWYSGFLGVHEQDLEHVPRPTFSVPAGGGSGGGSGSGGGGSGGGIGNEGGLY